MLLLILERTVWPRPPLVVALLTVALMSISGICVSLLRWGQGPEQEPGPGQEQGPEGSRSEHDVLVRPGGVSEPLLRRRRAARRR